MIVGEAGAPTVGGTIGSDQSQLTFYQAVAQLVADAGLSVFAPWILSDSTSTGIPKPLQNPITSAMGLRRLDGSWKPAAGVVRAMFGGARNLSFTANELAASKIDDDGGFDREDARASTTGRLGSWRPFDSGAGTLGVGRDVGVDGSAGAILRRTGGDHSTIPALTQTFLLLSGKRTVSVRAQLRLADATGFSGVGIAWFGGGRYLGGTESRSAEPAPGAWVAVSATATVPRPATSFQIHLESWRNSGSAYFDSVVLS